MSPLPCSLLLPQKAFAFSDPFMLRIGSEETVGQLKQRVQAKLEVPDEEFATWNVLLIS